MQQRLTQKSRGREHKKHCERYRAGKPAAILGAVGAGEREKERDRKKGIARKGSTTAVSVKTNRRYSVRLPIRLFQRCEHVALRAH